MNSVLSGDEKVSANYRNELAFESDFHVLETTDSMTEKDVEKESKRIKKITPSKTEMCTMFEKLYKYKNGNVSTQVYMLVGNGKRKRNVKIYVANNVALAEEVKHRC